MQATHNGDDKLGDTHTNSTNEQQASTTHSVDQLNSNDGSGSVDDVSNDPMVYY